ncbi:MAG TPA: hypothetical protein VHE81_21435 [Lacipirellulaceae bacterium]|nr:hypothetical protein [Lacipirellulaceae bacterium]
MDEQFVILLFIAGVIAVILVAIYSYQQQQKRLAEMAALARELNWQFDPESDYEFDNQYSQFSEFCQGSGRYAYNTLRGTVRLGGGAWPARMGDFHYETTSSDGKTTHTDHHHLSYLLVELPYPALPDLRIRREGIFDAVAHVFGFTDINFESSEFSRRFHVKSSDKKFAYDVIHPAMMEFMLASNPPTIEIGRGCCCLTDGSGTWPAAEFREQLDWAEKFFNLWPKYLVADLKTR